MLVHGTCIALASRGVLITGPSGAGKSDLALQLIDGAGRGIGGQVLGARLVADDQVRIARQGSVLMASAPERLRGLLEIRGLGIVRLDHLREARLHLAVELMPWQAIERYQEDTGRTELLGVPLATVALDPSRPSAAARIRASIAAVAQRRGDPV